MLTRRDLSQLDWTLSGWTPHLWRMMRTMEVGACPDAEVPGIPARVPGSVQWNLRNAGIIPDWNIGLNHRECEWVENRHWIFETTIPGDWLEPGKVVRLNCRGLDYEGCVTLNGAAAGEFRGSMTPWVFDLSPHIQEGPNILRIVFETSPRWMGQFGYTSRITDWKPRYYYTWDWTPRLVQTGIWDRIFIEVSDGCEIRSFRCTTDADAGSSTGTLRMTMDVSAGEGDVISLALERDNGVVMSRQIEVSADYSKTVVWDDIPVDLWWPNLEGDQSLYTVRCELLNRSGQLQDSATRRVGFRQIEWAPCEGAKPEADPWICVVNGRPVFLQGVNWVPPATNMADVDCGDYRRLLELYNDLGANIVRVWGGATLERECFYDMCDELGLMVWQEFPLSSSGIDNWPPEDEKSIEEMASIAHSYIERRQHHPSLIMWCGGNELLGSLDGGKVGNQKPCDVSHPMLRRMAEVVEQEDPGRRFVPASPGGPRAYGNPAEAGLGLQWDVHGPWKAIGDLDKEWTEHWTKLDALLCSETGAPSASSAQIIRRSAGDLDTLPVDASNPLWRRTSIWWIESQAFLQEMGREPASLEEYVQWSQARQARALSIAAGTCKDKFPRCGGILIWMGHDCFPCTANTSIIDFDCSPKPAALALKEIWRRPVGR